MSVTLMPPRHRVAPAPARTRLFPLAGAPILVIAGALVVVLLATSTRYGYFADELYFLAAGRELAWGYADQPPLVPLVARIMDTLFPDSLFALRTPSALAAGAGVLLVALLAREFGGGRRAQTWAAGAYAVAGQTLCVGHLLSTASFNIPLWTAITWLLVRWVRLREDRLLLWAGVLTAIAVQVKIIVPGFWVVLVAVILCTGPRELLRRPMLWCGAAITLGTATPTVLWQATHGWPQVAMSDAIAAEDRFGWLLPPVAIIGGGLIGGVLMCFGTWRLLRAAGYRQYRFLGWTALGVTALCTLSSGRPYYLAGFYGVLIAVGAVELCRVRVPGRRVTAAVFTASAAAVACLLPVLPVSAIQRFDVVSSGSIGWRQVTAAVVDTASRYPSQAIVTDDYWSASALRHYHPGISRVYSPNRGYWHLSRPPEGTDRVIYVGGDRNQLLRYFGSVQRVSTVDTKLAAETRYEGTPIYLAERPRQPWHQLWPRMHEMRLDPRLD